MIILPKFTYNGLTIILDNPSRFDIERKSLLTGFAGDWFNTECLGPDTTRWACEIRTANETAPLLSNTKAILALGNRLLVSLFSIKHSLGEQRGSPFMYRDIPVVASYLPQDTVDIKDWEGTLNPLAFKYEDEQEDEEDAAKSHGKTSRANFRFWLQRDTKKAIRICREGLTRRVVGTGGFRPVYYPEINKAIAHLNAHTDSTLYLDIETDYTRNLLCVGFSFGDGLIYVVPHFRYNAGLAYEGVALAKFLRALSLAMQRNIVVAHNGFGFDYVVLCWMYKVMLGRHYYDTMIAQHRCYPEVEKSLGHCISLWTDEPYHKAEGIIPPHDRQQEEQLWAYNAKDVATTQLVHKYQMEHAATVPGLIPSIDQGNSMIYPYLVTSMLGLQYDKTKLDAKIAYNDRVMTQQLRCMRLLTGKDFLPTSPKQCIEYFHDTLGYSVVNRNPATKAPKLGEKEIQKLKLKYPENPMLDFVLAYRAVKKETGSLGFTPWKE